jgi:hypothetical protein
MTCHGSALHTCHVPLGMYACARTPAHACMYACVRVAGLVYGECRSHVYAVCVHLGVCRPTVCVYACPQCGMEPLGLLVGV